MADIKQFGMFWGSDSLNFVESSGFNPGNMFQISYEVQPNDLSKSSVLAPWEKELASNIKRTLNKKKLSASKVNLSLPTKDIIFRSFTIPWMQQSEIKNVVSFEVSKYIPFSLDKLTYSFHPISIPVVGKKLIQIIFVAIKKTSLEKYTQILKAASMRINIIEPAASSLIRTLSFKKLIPKDETVALIEKKDIGRIIIIDNDIPQFVREFHLSPSTADEEILDPESIVIKLTKEVRISLDYFNRQNEQLRVKKIFYLSSSEEEELPENLEKYLDIPVAAIVENSVMENMSEAGSGILNAYGASIITASESPVLFNLSDQKTEAAHLNKPIIKVPFKYKLSLKTALMCFPIIIISIVAIIVWTQKLKGEIVAFNKKLGSFQDSDVSFIEKKDIKLKSELKQYKNIRTKSDVALFLLLIPDLLPEGTWLRNLDIAYNDLTTRIDASTAKKKKSRQRDNRKAESEASLTMIIDGYAYSENKNQQFRLVNEFLRKIKTNGELSNFFQNFDLETTQSQKLDDYNVTFFKIVCKQTNEH